MKNLLRKSGQEGWLADSSGNEDNAEHRVAYAQMAALVVVAAAAKAATAKTKSVQRTGQWNYGGESDHSSSYPISTLHTNQKGRLLFVQECIDAYRNFSLVLKTHFE